MGSVVKSIGKVFKKIGRAIKKAAPLILVAAAAYVGYGYATGFTGGGWPRITQWGKSLMSGIRGGNTISQAASQASQSFGQVASNVAPTSVPMDPGMGPGGASEFASQGLLSGTPTISPSGEYTAMGPFGGLFRGTTETLIGSDATSVPSTSGLTARDIRGRPPSLYEALFNPAEEQLVQAQVANPNDFEFHSVLEINPETYGSEVLGGTTSSVNQAANVGPSVNELLQSGDDLVPYGAISGNVSTVAKASNTWKDIVGLAGNKVKEASAWYKDLWASDPLVAMYGTQKIAEMMLTFLDDSAEKEAEAKAAVAGFPRRSFSDVMKSNRAARRRGASHTGGLLA